MISLEVFRKIALSFPESVELPHFEKQSFRVNKKIFATHDLKYNRAVVKLSLIDQSVFTSFDKSIIYPATGNWGKQGWTVIELKKVKKDLLSDVLTNAYCTVTPKRLSPKVFTEVKEYQLMIPKS